MRAISASTAALRPPAKSPARKAGRDGAVDDLPRRQVGHRAFQRLGHLDAHAPVVLGHHDQQRRRRPRGGRSSSCRRRAARRRRCPRAAWSAPSAPRSAAPLACSKAASLASSALRCAASSVPVWSMTRAVSAGTGSTSCAQASASAAHSQAASSSRSARIGGALRQRALTSMRRRRCRGLVEAHRRRRADRGLVLHREVGLDRVAEDHRRQVGREAARQHVVVVHRLDVAVARHGDAVLGAFELHAQVLEGLVGLQVRGSARPPPSAGSARRVSSPCAAWNFWKASGLLISSGVAWMLVALARASITLVSVSCSKLASPLTVADDVGDQVGAALVLVQHLGPGGLDLLVQALEVVVAAAGQQQRCQQGQQRSEASGDVHGASFGSSGAGCYLALRRWGPRTRRSRRRGRAAYSAAHGCIDARRCAAPPRRRARSAARAEVLLVVGGGGVLGSALLARALACGRFGRVQALVAKDLASALRGFEPLPQAALGRAAARRHCGHRLRARAAQQRPRRGLRAAATRAAGRAGDAAARRRRAPAAGGGAARAGAAAAGAEGRAGLARRRPRRRAGLRAAAVRARRAGGPGSAAVGWAQRLAAGWLSQLAWMVPQREQPVRALRLAELVVELAWRLPQARAGHARAAAGAAVAGGAIQRRRRRAAVGLAGGRRLAAGAVARHSAGEPRNPAVRPARVGRPAG